MGARRIVMIRTKTTVIVGQGALAELDFPTPAEVLARAVQAFDFQRLGSNLQTDDMQAFDALLQKVKGKTAALKEAAGRVRAASRLSPSFPALLQQMGEEQHLVAITKLAIAYFTLQAEDRSAMEAEPRDPWDLPLRGSENWLYQLAQLIIDGVPHARAEHSLDNLAIVSFGSDRAIQNYMPWALHHGFGMELTEARAICADRLKLIQPYGTAGRLDWQTGDLPAAEWGASDAKTLFGAAEGIRSAGEFSADRQARSALTGALSQSRRVVFLGFTANPLDTALLFDERLPQTPEALASLHGTDPLGGEVLRQVLSRTAGIGAEHLVHLTPDPSWQMLRANQALLGS